MHEQVDQTQLFFGLNKSMECIAKNNMYFVKIVQLKQWLRVGEKKYLAFSEDT